MKLAILGATGSIGRQTLDVVRTCLPEVEITVLTANADIKSLAVAVDEFKPKYVWLPSSEAMKELSLICSRKFIPLTGEDGLCEAACSADIVVNALVGGVGLKPTLAAINAGKNVALANKEALVAGGALVMPAAKKNNVKVTPIDSEHSAIWQCLKGNDLNQVEKIILTASGGPFRTWDRDKISKASAQEALRHPNWNMGAKITIDSATMMNKGLELIEAMWLFDMNPENIEIVIHPQSIIHSMVQYFDGSIMAQLGLPDMRLPILYALSAPNRVKNDYPRVDFTELNTLTFEEPDSEKFPCLALAKKAAEVGGTLPAVMNKVNEYLVQAYLDEKIRFYDISGYIFDAFEKYTPKAVTSIADINEAELWSRAFMEEYID